MRGSGFEARSRAPSRTRACGFASPVSRPSIAPVWRGRADVLHALRVRAYPLDSSAPLGPRPRPAGALFISGSVGASGACRIVDPMSDLLGRRLARAPVRSAGLPLLQRQGQAWRNNPGAGRPSRVRVARSGDQLGPRAPRTGVRRPSTAGARRAVAVDLGGGGSGRGYPGGGCAGGGASRPGSAPCWSRWSMFQSCPAAGEVRSSHGSPSLPCSR